MQDEKNFAELWQSFRIVFQVMGLGLFLQNENQSFGIGSRFKGMSGGIDATGAFIISFREPKEFKGALQRYF